MNKFNIEEEFVLVLMNLTLALSFAHLFVADEFVQRIDPHTKKNIITIKMRKHNAALDANTRPRIPFPLQ